MTWNGHRFIPGAPVNGARSIGTQYTPSTTAYVDHFVTVQLVNTAAQTAQVDLLSDTATPPTTLRARAKSDVVGTQCFQLMWRTFPGDNVKLVATGTGAATIVAQWEIPVHSATE